MTKKEIFDIICGKETVTVYRSFQNLEIDTYDNDLLYKYIDDLFSLLNNSKSYIKVRSFRLICLLSKYDIDKKIDRNIDLILSVFNDDRPTSIRQYLAGLSVLLLYKSNISTKIEKCLKSIDLNRFKDTMRPLIEKDINNILSSL